MFGREQTTRSLHRRTAPNRPRAWSLLLDALGVSGSAGAGAGAGAASAGAGASSAAGVGGAAGAGGGIATGLGANMTAVPAAGSFMGSPGMMYGAGGGAAAGPSMWDVVNHMVQNYANQGPVGQVAPDFARAHPYYAGAANAAMGPGGGGGRPPQATPPPPAMGRDPRQWLQMLSPTNTGMSPGFGSVPSILQTALRNMMPGYG